MGTPLRVLIVEDSADDAALIVRELQQVGYTPTYTRVETPAAMTAALTEPWDVVISAYILPHFDVLAALALVEARRLDLPFIIVSGNIGVEIAMAARRTGAHDSLMKDRIARLGIVVARALQDVTEWQVRQPVDTVPVLLWMAGPDRNCTYVNDAWLEYTGRTLEQELGQGWVDHMHPADVAPCFDTYITAFMARQPFEMAYRLRRADGVYRWVLERGVPVVTPEGLLTGYIGSTIDVTRPEAEQILPRVQAVLTLCGGGQTAALRQETAEDQRLEHEAQRVRHFALLDRLAAGVVHEIRNPLSALFLYIDLLEEELCHPSPNSQEAIAIALTAMKTNLVRLDNLVQDYLSLVRAGVTERTVHDLGAALQEWITEWQALVIASRVSLRLEGIEDLGQVAFHPGTLRRALLNLVQNALDAMPAGGILLLRGHSTAAHVQLQVCDTGSGIPPERLGQIFEPLYTTKPEGTGLGLSIVQEIMVAHEGQVTVESVPGQGTIFTLMLPRAVATTPAPTP